MSPIPFAHAEIVHAAHDSSAQGLSAYISRGVRKDHFTGASFNFSHKGNDLVHHEVALPDGAPERLRDAAALWNEATLRETTTDRQTRRVRFKKNAQTAKHLIIALPKELSDAERLGLTRRFVHDHFTNFGVAVEWAIHRPDDDSGNHHAHCLVTTRLATANGLGKKARLLNPEFSTSRKGRHFVSDQDHITDRWTEAQNEYFEELGLDLRVDPKRQIRAVHLGPSWHAPNDKLRQAAAAADLAAVTLMDNPAAVLKGITSQIATFTMRDLQKYVAKHGSKGERRDRAVKAALAHEQILPLFDPATGLHSDRFTTKEVRDQELRVIEHARNLMLGGQAASAEACAQAADRYTLDAEQLEALRFLTGGDGLNILIGRAGTGKSRVLSAVRAAYEADGYSVRGVAPTNTAAVALANDGFSSASTLHRALYRLRNGSEEWSRKTVVVMDEAAMADALLYEQVTKAAVEAGAKLILAGDDRQHGSVSRGGLFPELTSRFGAVALRRVRRQGSQWQREASESFARGDTASGLKAYSDRGFLNWETTIDDSRARLVKDWSSDRDQDCVKFIYASTNVEVDRINILAQSVRRQRGDIGPGRSLETARGRVELSCGDRIQFYGNDRRAGIFNGVIGTVQTVDLRRVEVITDSGAIVAFDPAKFSQWGLGYCGSVYRGQGKTQLRVFAFYDNPYAWNAKTAYVGLTRHKSEVRLYASCDLATDEPALARLMSRIREDAASIRYETVADQSGVLSRLDEQLNDLRRRMGLGERPDLNTFKSLALSGIHAQRKRRTSGKSRKIEPPPRRPR